MDTKWIQHRLDDFYLVLWGDLCFSGRYCATCEEGANGALYVGCSSSGLQITEAHINEGEVEGFALVHHLVEEFHSHRDQMEHSIIGAA